MTEPTCPRCGRRPGAFLTLKQASECINLPEKTLARYVHDLRSLPKVSVGLPGRQGKVRVIHSDLDALVRVRPAEQRTA